MSVHPGKVLGSRLAAPQLLLWPPYQPQDMVPVLSHLMGVEAEATLGRMGPGGAPVTSQTICPWSPHAQPPGPSAWLSLHHPGSCYTILSLGEILGGCQCRRDQRGGICWGCPIASPILHMYSALPRPPPHRSPAPYTSLLLWGLVLPSYVGSADSTHSTPSPVP